MHAAATNELSLHCWTIREKTFTMSLQGQEAFTFYRGQFPADAHLAFVFLRAFQNAQIPDHPTHVPLANDSTLADSQKVRYELEYLLKIFESWLKEFPALKEQLSLQNLLAMKKGKVEKLHMEYKHDGLNYESFPRLGAKMRAGGRGKAHYYLQIPLSNNGYLYRIISDADIGLRNLSLHRGSTHPAGIGGYVSLTKDAAADFYPFVAFAASWFECGAENLNLAVFYNGAENRVDVVVERKNHPNDGDKVSLEFCFEPGFPIKEFDEATFRVTKAEIDDQEKKRAARSSM